MNTELITMDADMSWNEADSFDIERLIEQTRMRCPLNRLEALLIVTRKGAYHWAIGQNSEWELLHTIEAEMHL